MDNGNLMAELAAFYEKATVKSKDVVDSWAWPEIAQTIQGRLREMASMGHLRAKLSVTILSGRYVSINVGVISVLLKCIDNDYYEVDLVALEHYIAIKVHSLVPFTNFKRRKWRWIQYRVY